MLKTLLPQPLLRLIGMLVLAVALVAACSDSPSDGGNNDDDDDPPPPPEEPLEPTFTNVHQILRTSCGGSQCHLEQSESGVNLSSYSNVMGSVGDQYGTEIVQPGDGAGSPIVDKIQPNPNFGERMPLEGGPLDDDEIQLIIDWIDDGAPDN